MQGCTVSSGMNHLRLHVCPVSLGRCGGRREIVGIRSSSKCQGSRRVDTTGRSPASKESVFITKTLHSLQSGVALPREIMQSLLLSSVRTCPGKSGGKP